MGSRFTELVVDCRDAPALAAFWAAVLGWEQRAAPDEGDVELVDPAGLAPTLLFTPVPEGNSSEVRAAGVS